MGESMSSTLLKSAADTEQFAEQFSNTLKPPALIFLEGELGAGKTTFMKGLLRGLGFQGTVKSQTFTLVETYDIGARRVVHADFFRFVFDMKNDVIPQISARQNHLTGDRELQLRFLKTHAITAARDDISKPVYHNVVIVIDPGHGGKDPGAVGAAGTHEKNVVLSISKALQALMNARPGFRAVLTRNTDRYISLRERLRIARKDHADMFIAIHADTWRNRHARGVSVFALSQRGATSEAARWLATRENASELMGGVDLQDKSHLLKSVLINLSQSATIRASLQIGDKVIQSARSITRLHHDRVEQAAFVVLKSPDIPSLLVETGFLSNPEEERRLRNPVFQCNIAKAMMQGICNYFVNYPPRRA